MIEYHQEQDYGAQAVIQRVLEQGLEAFGLGNMRVEVLLTGEQTLRRLNQTHRGIDKTTDVLSFPNFEGDISPTRVEQYLGSIAIAYPRAQSQAREYGHTLERELGFLAVHGLLHLLGYDHQTSRQENEMRELSEQILEACNVTREL